MAKGRAGVVVALAALAVAFAFWFANSGSLDSSLPQSATAFEPQSFQQTLDAPVAAPAPAPEPEPDPTPPLPTSMLELLREVLRDHAGLAPAVVDALFDAEMFVAATNFSRPRREPGRPLNNGSSSSSAPASFLDAPDPPRRREDNSQGLPANLVSLPLRLVYLKRYAGVAFGSLAFSAQLTAALHRHRWRLERSAAASPQQRRLRRLRALAFRRAVGELAAALAGLVLDSLQLAVDTVDDLALHATLQQAAAVRPSQLAGCAPFPDVVVCLLAAIRPGTTPEDVAGHLADLRREAALIADSPAAVVEALIVVEPTKPIESDVVGLFKTEALRELSYNTAAQLAPRRRARCHSLDRDCEHPDACRFTCNMPAILAGAPPGSHRVIGMGSNNDFSWELSLLRRFQQRQQPALRLMATFDCTLTLHEGRRQWRPPQTLLQRRASNSSSSSSSSKATTRAPFVWLQASVCIGSAVRQGSSAMVAFRDLLAVVQAWEAADRATPHVIRRFGMLPRSARNAQRDSSDEDGGDKEPSALAGYDVSMFKADVEGSEYATVHEWLRDDLSSVRWSKNTNAKHRANGTNGTFGTNGITDEQVYRRGATMLNAAHVQFEIHSRFHHASLASAWWQQWLLLELSALGYTLVSMEKNFWNACCSELVFPHHGFFVESEVQLETQTYDRKR